ncbi:type II secretion system F family protein [Methylibium sp.]|uniref:type II secretion system F family protein n=1 Tax=Methylibium sp. TaxID=2067992 RepID=UPI003D12B752
MQYAIKAVRRLQSASLTVEAADLPDARRQAERQGYAVMEIRAARRWPGLLSPRAADFPLLQFNQSLLILLQAGLSVVEAVETLAERETRADIRQVLARLTEHLNNGLSLSAALERQGAVFPALYIASVRANERTGALSEAIERFIAYRSQSELLRKRVISAAIYPAMILGVGALVIAFLLFYVVPRFSQVFQDLGERIPLMSRLLLQWGTFVHSHGVAVLSAGLVGVGLAVYAMRRPAVRALLMRQVQRLPRIGEYLRTYQLARFYRALGMLQRAGMPIITALDMALGLLPAAMHAALARARRDIGEGRSISTAFEQNGLTTAVSLRLLRVGERTGRMGEMLERSASFHDEDIAQAIDWFIRLFEPLLMIGIGIVIGVVVLLMYAPIFELAGSLQ